MQVRSWLALALALALRAVLQQTNCNRASGRSPDCWAGRIECQAMRQDMSPFNRGLSKATPFTDTDV